MKRGDFQSITNNAIWHKYTAEILPGKGLSLEFTTIEQEFQTGDRSIYTCELIYGDRKERIKEEDIDSIIKILQEAKRIMLEVTND